MLVSKNNRVRLEAARRTIEELESTSANAAADERWARGNRLHHAMIALGIFSELCSAKALVRTPPWLVGLEAVDVLQQ